MPLIKVDNVFSTKSYYIRTILTKLKRENKFHIEDYEEVIEIEDFFEELINIADKERINRQGVNSANN